MEKQETKRIFAKNLKAILTRNGVTQADQTLRPPRATAQSRYRRFWRTW